MTNVTRSDITKAVCELGVQKGDIVLVHSSFKSMGHVEGGAEAVIGGFLDAIGDEGTLVFPTFCQKDFEHSYETWHMDKESDVGYLTNYFRKREGSLRSDQATHSVAVCGKYAEELTKTHGHTHKRFGNFGNTPFSADSPWEKMYKMNAKIVLLGVDVLKVTFRHYTEYLYIEECLNSIKGHPDYEQMKEKLWSFGKKGVWPHLYNKILVERLDKMGKVHRSKCGDAILTEFSSKEFVDLALGALRRGDESVLWRQDEIWNTDEWIEWAKALQSMKET